MTEIILNNENLDYMRRITASAAIPHAIIIEGAAGSGKYTLALHFASMINCDSENEKPCGSCSSCIKIEQNVHADISVIDVEDGKKTIPVEKVREIISDASLIPSEAKKRVFIIRNGQALTPQAQNALLKIFEEPPKDVVFLLLTTDKRLLLPTIVSRGILLKMQLLPREIIKEELKKHSSKPDSDIEAVIAVSGGSLGQAQELLKGTKILKLRELVEAYFSVLKSTPSVFSLCEVFSPHSYKREELFAVFPFFKYGFRDIALCKSGAEFVPMFFTDTELMECISEKISSSNLVKLYQKTDELCLSLYSNVNPHTAISVFNSYVSEYSRLG